jgi:hypothetical protein
MSNRYKGGVISATPPTLVAGAGASGTWTLEQQMQATAAGLWPVNGPFYIEDVFSTYLVTGDGTAPAVNNGIDLSGQGGLVWTKKRSAAGSHSLFDTARGANLRLISNDTAAQDSVNLSFTSTGFSNYTFDSGVTYATWTFREQPKFFDIVTYTGDGTNGRTVAHNLGSAPGCIIIKRTSATGPWYTWHRSLTADKVVYLNTTAAQADPPYGAGSWISSDSTTVTFPNASIADVNNNGFNYVMYVFAHNAGGFGLTGTDNVISCGSFTVDGSGNSSINLGYEPQWLLMKQTNTTGSWLMQDTMRGQTADNGYARLLADTSGAETSTTTGFIRINATGFSTNGATGLVGDHIYIAIRRGPMRVPTDATSVLDVETWSGNSSGNRNISVGFPADLNFFHVRNDVNSWNATDRLRGNGQSLQFDNTGAQINVDPDFPLFNSFQNELKVTGTGAAYINETGYNQVFFSLRRAPSFFDEVCYTGTDVDATAFNHSLGVKPEMIWIKARSAGGSLTGAWFVWSKINSTTYATRVNQNTPFGLHLTSAANASTSSTVVNGATSTTFTPAAIANGSSTNVNSLSVTYVAYLFATCAGVSKVGSYTGTGTTLQIDCGFTAGSRFVLIKRTDSTGDWYVWDSARGIVAGNDPYLLLNSTAAEVTGTDYVDTYNAGFEISSTAPAGINASAGTYIFLAIA